jgi:hypothetical protein
MAGFKVITEGKSRKSLVVGMPRSRKAARCSPPWRAWKKKSANNTQASDLELIEQGDDDPEAQFS